MEKNDNATQLKRSYRINFVLPPGSHAYKVIQLL